MDLLLYCSVNFAAVAVFAVDDAVAAVVVVVVVDENCSPLSKQWALTLDIC